MLTRLPMKCADCKRVVEGGVMFTEVNPEGGYGMPRVFVCDDCMRSEEWAGWRSRKWPNWPEIPPRKPIS